MHGEHGADGDPLLLATREGAQVAGAQVGDAEQVEGLLDPAAHGRRGQAELLHAVGQLLLDGVGDEAEGRVLTDVPDHVRPVPRRTAQHALALEQHVAGEHAPGEARHQTGDDTEQRGLADAGGSREQDELALLDDEVDVGEDGGLAGAVAETDAAQLEDGGAHAATASAWSWARRPRETGGETGGGAARPPARATATPTSTPRPTTGTTSRPG